MKTRHYTSFSKLLANFMLITLALMLFIAPTVNNTRVYASDGMTLDDLMNQGNKNQQNQGQSSQQNNNYQSTNGNLIDDLSSGLDHSNVDSEIVQIAGKQINYWFGIAIQVLAYLIIGGMTVSKVVDLAYIAIPFTRKWLSNGYMGNAQAAGTPGAQNPMMGGMGAPGMGMGGMGAPGMGMGMGGMGGMGMRGRYGMGGGMGMGMGGMGAPGMADGAMAAQNQPALGRIQFVSNAALNAVAVESVVGTDGKSQNAFKVYFSDMLISSVVTAILLVLSITGVVSKLGFMLGNVIADIIRNINV